VEPFKEMNESKSAYKARPWRFRFKERRSLLLIGDLIVAILAMIGALYFWASTEKFIGFSMEFIQRRVPPWFFLFPVFWLLLLVELYDVYRAGDWIATIKGVATAALIGFGLYLLLFFSYADPPKSLLPRRGVASFLVIVSICTLLWRRLYIRIFSGPRFMRRVLLVGGGNSGRLMINIYKGLKPPPFQLMGIIDDDPDLRGIEIEGVPVVGSHQDLLNLIEEMEIADLIVAISGKFKPGMFQTLLQAQEIGVDLLRMPKVYEELLGRVPVQMLEADWILRSFTDQLRTSVFFELIKRLMDIIGSVIALVFLCFLTPFIALAIFLDNGAPIFYSQMREGRAGQHYKLFKFRTMYRNAEPNGNAQWAKEDDRRTTRSGKILRKTHLDELPQVINVLRGEMSLVGPRAERPELVTDFEKNIPFYRARLLVKPGITGWAQINYGYAATIEETAAKLEYDLYYIKNRSIWMDVLILLRTPATVYGLRGR
jgi:exopolysaccharide biosynthesis polyprenyl glycosylphosphotransferase